jgi:mannan endo-1,4-beta-mannosidase
VQNGQFVHGGKPYYFMGANYWYGGIASLSAEGRKRVVSELNFLQRQGISNLRILAAAEGRGPINGMRRVEPPYQHPQGIFNDTVLTGLDFVLAEMAKRGMTAVLYLTNNWDWSGGFLQYLNWNGLLPDSAMHRKLTWDENRDVVSRFYSCPPCMQACSEQVKRVVTRVNSITGVAYKNDPTILSWQLANEPRPMRPAAINAYVQWIQSTAALIKSLDANHLVTAGVEGEAGTETIEVFKTVHSLPQIDYATIHIWPKNWGWFKDTAIGASIDAIISNSNSYITRHKVVMEGLQKPMVIEEFGLPRDGHSYSLQATTLLRDKYYASVFEHVATSALQKGVVAGCNFWTFGGQGRPAKGRIYWQPGDDLLGDPPQEEQGLNAVFDTDKSTWTLISNKATAIQK